MCCPNQLNFGLVSLIAPSRRTITIINNGFEDLEVTDIQVDVDGTGAFTAPGASGGRLAAGEFLPITIEFQPQEEGPVQSTLLIRSNDQDEPEVSVTLLGEGINLPPCSYEVIPAQLSFGVVERSRSVGRGLRDPQRGLQRLPDHLRATAAWHRPGVLAAGRRYHERAGASGIRQGHPRGVLSADLWHAHGYGGVLHLRSEQPLC